MYIFDRTIGICQNKIKKRPDGGCRSDSNRRTEGGGIPATATTRRKRPRTWNCRHCCGCPDWKSPAPSDSGINFDRSLFLFFLKENGSDFLETLRFEFVRTSSNLVQIKVSKVSTQLQLGFSGTEWRSR